MQGLWYGMISSLRRFIRRTLFLSVLRLYYRAPSRKAADELHFWDSVWLRSGGRPGGLGERHAEVVRHFVGGEPDSLLIVDFGCGPVCGLDSLAEQNIVIGVDLLAEHYERMLRRHGFSHRYRFMACSETRVPLESGSVDLIYTANALDHCDDPYVILDELRRCLKGNGQLIGVFNIEPCATLTEPSPLKPDELEAYFRGNFASVDIVRCPRGAQGAFYDPFLSGARLKGGDAMPEKYLVVVHAREPRS